MSELIAEARVLVTPDTSGFRALLIAEVTAAAKGVTAPIQVTPVVTGQTGAVAAATKALSKEAAAAATATKLLTDAELALAGAETRVLVSSGQAAAARTRFTAATRASALTERAYEQALKSGDDELVKRVELERAVAATRQQTALQTLRAAQATSVEAAANKTLSASLTEVNARKLEGAAAAKAAAAAQTQEAAARRASLAASAAQTKALTGLGTGAGSAAASLLGVRGATLAATGPFLAGAAGAIALSKSLALATSFNSEIAVLGATTGATGVQLEQAAEAAREFGRDITLPGVTAGDAAKTITEFSKAGLDLNESIAATRGGLQLAQAAQLSYTDAVTLTANALNAFNLSGNQAVRVADTLANASNLAQGGIGDTALALRQAASAAEVVGVSFEDTTALLTLLARNGLSGSDAGTALRTAFLRLVNPSKEANAILKSLNVNLRDIQGNIRPEAFADFANAQRDLSVATQQANAAIVFGQDAFRAIGILGSEGAEGLTEVQIALRKTGTAAELAQARMVGLAGATENLSNQVSSLGESAGQVASPGVELLVNQLADAVAGANEATGAIKDLVSELNELGPGPSGTDILGGDIFGIGIGDVFGATNPITGVASPIGQLRLFKKLFGDESEDSAEEVKNGGVLLRDALETSGRTAARGAVSFADQITGAIESAFALVEQTMRQANQSARAAAIREVNRSQGQAAGLEEQFDAIVAGGGDIQTQRANLVRQAKEQADIIAAAGTDAAGVQLEKRREARGRLAQINQQIASIDDQILADQAAANAERQRNQQDLKRDRDAAFLQSQDDARTRQERSVTIAGDTEGLRDDIREQSELRTLITQQIAAIKQSALSEKAKQAAIRDLRAERNRTTDTIRELRQANAELRAQQRQEALDERASQLEFLTELATLRENESGQVSGLRAEIQFWRKVALNAEKGSKAQRDAILTVERKRKELRDLLEKQEEDLGGGKSLAEFLTENQNLFNQVASSGGISGVDPLTGFDFSASIVDKTRRLQEAAKLGVSVTGPQAKVAPADPQIERLIAALEANTLATEGNTGGTGGNGGTTYAKTLSARGQALGDFWQARQARIMEQARFDGGGGV